MDEQTYVADGQLKNIMHSLTLSNGKGVKTLFIILIRSYSTVQYSTV